MKSCAVGAVALAVLCLALVAPAPAAASEGDATLVAMERALWEAWKAHDRAPFEQHLAEGSVNTTAAGRTSGKAEQIAMLSSADCEVASFTLGDIAVQRFGDHTAVLTYDATQDAVCEGHRLAERVMVTSVWVEMAGKWQAVSYQETVAAPPPAP